MSSSIRTGRADFRSTPTFIVGTGRCGSTMLSNMIREHTQILSLSEFFVTVSEGSRLPECFAPDPIGGRRFWAIVSATAPMLSFVLRNCIRYDECIYPCDDPAARFSRRTGVPAILATTLPHLTDDHDRLFDLLQNEVTQWTSAPIAEHYRHLFDWLRIHFGKRLWIERGGVSLPMVEAFQAMFPGARFILILRDGRDTAMSMRQHTGMRIYYAMSWLGDYLGVDPLTSSDRSRIDKVPPELRAILPERFDIDAFNAYEVPLPHCGEIWSQQIGMGLKVLAALPADRLLTLRYEDILADPKRHLDTLATFLGEDYVDEDWSARCAATVRPPRSTWRDLPEKEVLALTEACRPGFEALSDAGVEYEV
jgi:putative sulfotransferase